MARLERLTYRGIYRGAERAEELPWHHQDLPELLDERLSRAGRTLRVLDVGCGAGTFAVQMAERGHRVTGIDFMPRAIEIAGERAREAGVELDLHEADAFEWTPDEPFDLVFDSGCLHSFRLGDRERYKRQLLKWLGDDAEYVLVHFAPLFPMDWRPIGPRRRRPERVHALLAPELVEVDRRERTSTAPFPVGDPTRDVRVPAELSRDTMHMRCGLRLVLRHQPLASSRRRMEFIARSRKVARPAGVLPNDFGMDELEVLLPPVVSRVDQKETAWPVAGSIADRFGPLSKLHRAHASARLSRASRPPC